MAFLKVWFQLIKTAHCWVWKIYSLVCLYSDDFEWRVWKIYSLVCLYSDDFEWIMWVYCADSACDHVFMVQIGFSSRSLTCWSSAVMGKSYIAVDVLCFP